MARQLLFMKAINEALDQAMAKDDTVILLGEDIAGGVTIKHLEEENEDILVHVVPRTQAYQWVVEGKIDNVIAVIGLQWLELNYKRYQ